MSTYYYSPSTTGFYLEGFNKVIPEDAIEITKEYWQELIQGQSSGKKISQDENGYPILTDHVAPVLTYYQSRANEYPIVGDQLDMLWHAIDQGTLDKTSSFYTTIADIKNRFPKE
jgi:hypothetical protein